MRTGERRSAGGVEYLADLVLGERFDVPQLVLFQWAGRDIFVSGTVRRRFAKSAPRALVDFYPASDRQLTDTALAARDAFLARELGLSG